MSHYSFLKSSLLGKISEGGFKTWQLKVTLVISAERTVPWKSRDSPSPHQDPAVCQPLLKLQLWWFEVPRETFMSWDLKGWWGLYDLSTDEVQIEERRAKWFFFFFIMMISRLFWSILKNVNHFLAGKVVRCWQYFHCKKVAEFIFLRKILFLKQK